MTQMAFDTQQFVETLESGGLTKEQAKAISLAVRQSHEAVDVATKRDLDDLRKDIDARFEKMDASLEKLELRMTVKLGLMMMAAVGLMVTLQRIL